MKIQCNRAGWEKFSAAGGCKTANSEKCSQTELSCRRKKKDRMYISSLNSDAKRLVQSPENRDGETSQSQTEGSSNQGRENNQKT